jgi:hypothetical protein
MADVTGQTLRMAIQAVRDAMVAMEARLEEAGDDDDLLDDTEMLMGDTKAAHEWQMADEIARATSTNLPPDAQVVPTGGGGRR